MKTKIQNTYDHSIEKIVDLLTSVEYAEAEYKSRGDIYEINEHVRNEKLYKLDVTQTLNMNDQSLPAVLKKLFSKRGKFTSKTQWDLANPQKVMGHTEMIIEGMPVSITMQSTLEPRGNQTKDNSTIEAKAKVPIIGKQIEKHLLSRSEFEFNDMYRRVCEHLSTA